MSIDNQESGPGDRMRAIENAGESVVPSNTGQPEDRPWTGGINPKLLSEAKLTPKQTRALKQGEYITLTPVQARARESLAGIDGHIAQINRGGGDAHEGKERESPSKVEILREAVRRDIPIGPQTTISELAREVGGMMGGLLEVPGNTERGLEITQRSGRRGRNIVSTKITGRGLTEMESIAARGEGAVLAHLAGQTVMQVASRRDVLNAELVRQLANVPAKLAQIGAIGKVLDVIESGALAAKVQSEKTETFLPQKRGFFSWRSDDQQPIRVTKKHAERHGLAPGTRINLRKGPDVPTRIASSMFAAGFAYAGGKGAKAMVGSSGGHAMAAASGENGAVAMAASSVIGGAELGGGGGLSIDISGSKGFDFDL